MNAPRKFNRIAIALVPTLVLMLVLVYAVSAAADLTDSTIAKFQAGSGCYVAPSAWDGGVAGEVILTPTIGEAFGGTAIPTGWYSGSYNSTNLPVVANGFITVNAAYAGTNTNYGDNRSLEFEAMFTGSGQYVGFASDQNLGSIPWILFGTFGSSTNLSVDTRSGAGSFTQVTTVTLGTPHRFLIDRGTNTVSYYVDGALVATQSIDVGLNLHLIIADNASDLSTSLAVDWLRMSDYAPSPCTFESRIFNAGVSDPTWNDLLATTAIPVGTGVQFDTRAGHTSAVDGTWTGWSPLTGTAIAAAQSGNQYIQYRATLSSSDPSVTPEVSQVTITGSSPTAVTLVGVSAQSTSSPVGLLWALGVLGFIAYGYRVWKARKLAERR